MRNEVFQIGVLFRTEPAKPPPPAPNRETTERVGRGKIVRRLKRHPQQKESFERKKDIQYARLLGPGLSGHIGEGDAPHADIDDVTDSRHTSVRFGKNTRLNVKPLIGPSFSSVVWFVHVRPFRGFLPALGTGGTQGEKRLSNPQVTISDSSQGPGKQYILTSAAETCL